MFERFTERARQVIVLAQEEVRKLGHAEITTDHILLGLIREEEGLAARVLEQLVVVNFHHIEKRVEESYLKKETPAGQIPFTPEAKKTLELALREALALGHNYIGTEHILLGLVRDHNYGAVRTLESYDVWPIHVRDKTMEMLSGQKPPKADPEETDADPQITSKRTGMTVEEARVMEHIVGAYQGILGLGLLANKDELSQAIHTLQMFVMMRVLNRNYPDFWEFG